MHFKYLFLLIISFLLNFINFQLKAQHNHEKKDKPATHGMLLFGKDKVFASHLPMFHSPHDYQVILELEFDAKTKNIFISDQKKYPEHATYTIEPEKFILPDMIKSPVSFKINLYRGHFERGGTKIASNATVKIKQVVYYEQFNPNNPKAITNNFILFGGEKEQFIIHQITNKPDFEQIIEVKATLNIPANQKYNLFSMQNAENKPIGVSGNNIMVNINNNQQNIMLLKQIYLEFDDLKE